MIIFRKIDEFIIGGIFIKSNETTISKMEKDKATLFFTLINDKPTILENERSRSFTIDDSMICRQKKRGKIPILATIDELVFLRLKWRGNNTKPRSICRFLYARVPPPLPPLCCIFHGASIPARKSRVNECITSVFPDQSKHFCSFSRTRDRSLRLLFRRIGKGGIRWQKKKEIRYVNGHCTPLKPRFLCLDAKIWKQIKFERGKGKKKGGTTIFFFFFLKFYVLKLC